MRKLGLAGTAFPNPCWAWRFAGAGDTGLDWGSRRQRSGSMVTLLGGEQCHRKCDVLVPCNGVSRQAHMAGGTCSRR
jgi:hypothetical protein